MKAALLMVVTCLLYSGMAGAEIYKWVDKKGETHFQDHPRGKVTGISMDEGGGKHEIDKSDKIKTQKLIRDMDKARRKREKQRHKKLAEQKKQDEKCLKMRSRLRKAQAKLDKNYSEFSNDRPASYARRKADLEDRKKYLNKYCN